MSMRVETVHLDLDDVLVDFRTACCKLLKIHPKECFELSRRKGVWGICEAIGLSQQYLWDELDAAGSEFWISLQKFSYTDELVKMVADLNASRVAPSLRSQYITRHCSILTHTGPDEQKIVETGKQKLLTKLFPNGLGYASACRDKTTHAHPGSVLIDDSPHVCAKWEERGGYAIQFPSPVYYPEVIEQGTQLKFVRERLYKALLEA